jgi:hypothetical protein
VKSATVSCRVIPCLIGLSVVCVLTGCKELRNVKTPHRHDTAIPHLYAYDLNDIERHLQTALSPGDEGYYYDPIHPNPARDALYLHQSPLKGRRVLVITGKDQFEFLARPADHAYSGSSDQFVAWYNRFEDGIQFQSGDTIRLPLFWGFGFDLSGEYFFKSSEDISYISLVETPEQMVASVPFRIRRLFVKENKLFVFGDDPGYRTTGLNGAVMCRIYKVQHSTLEVEKDFPIPRPKAGPSPFAVLDLDRWSDNVLLIDIRDFPGRSKWVLFDMKDSTMKDLGPSSTFGFFLDHDVFSGW